MSSKKLFRIALSSSICSLLLLVSTFSFGQSKGKVYLPEQSAKFRRVQNIVDKLRQVVADPKMTPHVRVEKADPKDALGYPAQLSYVSGVPVLTIEEELLDALASHFQRSEEADAALSFVLAHELAHYYLEHGWENRFACAHKAKFNFSTEVMQHTAADVSDYDTRKREAEADRIGLFYMRLAGLGACETATQAIKVIYQRYALPDDLPGYPKLSERMAMLHAECAEAGTLAHSFEFAQLLFSIGSYKACSSVLGFVGQKLPTKEIYISLGISAFYQALELMDSKKAELQYPFATAFEIASLRSDGAQVTSETARVEQLNSLLKLSKGYFEQALSVHEGYWPAMLGMAAYHQLSGLPGNELYSEAVLMTVKADTLVPKGVLAASNVLLSNLRFGQGRVEEALALLRLAQNELPGVVSWNTRVMEARPLHPLEVQPIDGIRTPKCGSDIFNTTSWKSLYVHPIEERGFKISSFEEGSCRAFRFDEKSESIVAQSSGERPSVGGQSLVSTAHLRKHLGEPDGVIPLAGGGYFWIYKKQCQMAFKVGEDNQIQRSYVYGFL